MPIKGIIANEGVEQSGIVTFLPKNMDPFAIQAKMA